MFNVHQITLNEMQAKNEFKVVNFYKYNTIVVSIINYKIHFANKILIKVKNPEFIKNQVIKNINSKQYSHKYKLNIEYIKKSKYCTNIIGNRQFQY